MILDRIRKIPVTDSLIAISTAKQAGYLKRHNRWAISICQDDCRIYRTDGAVQPTGAMPASKRLGFAARRTCKTARAKTPLARLPADGHFRHQIPPARDAAHVDIA